MIFYHLGRTDTESVFRRIILAFVVLRLKEMTPTSRERIPYGYGLRDTAHWFTCLSEVLGQAQAEILAARTDGDGDGAARPTRNIRPRRT